MGLAIVVELESGRWKDAVTQNGRKYSCPLFLENHMSFALRLCLTLRISAGLFSSDLDLALLSVYFLSLRYRSESKAKQAVPGKPFTSRKVTSNLRTLDLASASTPPSSNTRIVDSRYFPLIYRSTLFSLVVADPYPHSIPTQSHRHPILVVIVGNGCRIALKLSGRSGYK